jgi:Tol biopolymer transport system component
MATRHSIACAAFLLICGFVVALQDRGNDLLQQALVKERAEGNLKEAIKIYGQIVQKYGANRPLAAKALLQMGRCYERLGQADARRTYERLVKEYGDQNEPVTEARTRLAALIAAEGKPKFTKIRVPTKLPSAGQIALSPDGQQLAYVSDGAVWLLPVHGASHPEIAGPPRRITEPVPTWVFAQDIVWSRDGKWLALYVFERPSQGSEFQTIYLVPSAGGEPRKAPLPKVWNHAGDWVVGLSPDGEWLAFTSRKKDEPNGRNSVFIAPSAGGAARMVTPPISNQPQFSPDGKRIAYVGRLPGPERDPKSPVGRQVWVTDVDGGTPALIFELPPGGRLNSPVWSPDGRMLAFLATLDNPGIMFSNYGLLFIAPIAPDGRPAGPPAKIELPHKTMGKLAGWSKDNRIGLALPAPEIEAIYTVPASGGKAVQLTPKEASMPSWTPDGKRIYFAGAHHGTVASIEYVPAAGGPVVRIPVRGPHPVEQNPPWGGISVSPDGRKILFGGHYSAASAKLVAHVFTLPAEGGQVADLLTAIHELSYPCWSPDGKQIAFVSAGWPGDDWIHNIYTIPADGGSPRRLTSASDKVDEAYIAWSPDGRFLAYHSLDDKIRLLPLAGGPSQVLVEGLRRNRWASGLAWSPDGKELAYAAKDRIWKVNLQSRKSEEVQTGLDAMHTQMAWSPDGKTIAFSAYQGGDPELWLVEDFLGALKK